MMELQRPCGICSKPLFYKKKDSFEKAVKNNSMCPSCRTARNNKNRNVRKESNPAWKGFEGIPGKFLSKAKNGARNRDLCFEVTLKDIWDKYLEQDKKCSLTGWPISFDDNASLDRIDSNIGYTKENIQLLDKAVNMMKRDYPEDFFIAVCKAVSQNKE
jgi:hypothetical protein